MICSFLTAQEYGTDKGSIMVSGMFSLNHQTGKLFEDIDGAGTTSTHFNSSCSYFVLKGLFGGLGTGYTYQRTGANGAEQFEIGPHIGYALGKKESKIYPYITGGVHYAYIMAETDSYASNTPGTITLKGHVLFGGLGAMFKIYDHLGVTMEVDYSKYQLKEFIYDYKGSGLSLSIGVVGYIF